MIANSQASTQRNVNALLLQHANFCLDEDPSHIRDDPEIITWDLISLHYPDLIIRTLCSRSTLSSFECGWKVKMDAGVTSIKVRDGKRGGIGR